jgi:hypothetical protein
VTPADLVALLRDALRLWGTEGHVSAEKGHVAVTRPDGIWRISPGPPPTRWFLQTPEREAAGRPARPAPSITALLSALRAALGLPRGTPARIGATGTVQGG